MPVTRRDWWIGIAVVFVAVIFHALVPRYEWNTSLTNLTAVRTDRWTGAAEVGVIRRAGDDKPGQWVSVREIARDRARVAAAAKPSFADDLAAVERETKGRFTASDVDQPPAAATGK